MKFLLTTSEKDEKRRGRGNGMERSKFVLAVLSSCPEAIYNPVQVQKLFFLIDRKISELVGGPYFNFTPYHYGPFDKQVYSDLEALSTEGLLAIEESSSYRTYTTTKRGQTNGVDLLKDFPDKARGYIKELSDYVRGVSFNELVSSIYQAYPEMRANSVFRD
jgi:hypothetical protein